ncbi:structure-specific recognition protein [Culex quinquefasciatus]|uniref:FACT complex subunit SSRP1 n=1 Tax=Culex quinquefasciatus TaxID=7176 RepID=B0WV30_CULQU|nr:structure-specific recognition protein [Culex quinquefasciatus]|eukprot:XP_001860639.1 structure-specific recognition protein [Culex quinquefasciatus]
MGKVWRCTTTIWVMVPSQRRRESPTVVPRIRVRIRKLSFLDDLPRGPDGRVGPDGMTLSALVTSRFFRHVATCRVFLPPDVVRRVSPTDVRSGWVVAQQQISKTPDRVPGQLACWVAQRLTVLGGGGGGKELSGPVYEVLGKIMKVINNRKLTGTGTFIGHSGTPAVGCSYKAAAGYIYPLERGFIYVHKPRVHIRFEEIASVNFARSGGSTSSFDFEIELKTGNIYAFSSISKEIPHPLSCTIHDCVVTEASDPMAGRGRWQQSDT